MENETLFTMGVQALGQGEWRIGHEFIRRCEGRVQIADLVDRPELAFAVAWCNVRAGYATGREFQRLIENRNEANWLGGAAWPEHLAGQLFDEGVKAVRSAINAGHWEIVTNVGAMLLHLPAATNQREEVLVKIFAEVFAAVVAEQTSVIALIDTIRRDPNRPQMIQSAEPTLLKTVCGTCTPFDVPAELLGAAALADGYPALASQLLWAVLRDARWPVLAFFDTPLRNRAVAGNRRIL